MGQKAYVYVYSKKHHTIVEHEGYLGQMQNGKLGIFKEPYNKGWTHSEFSKNHIMTSLGGEGNFDGTKVWFTKPNKKRAIDIFLEYELRALTDLIVREKEHEKWIEWLKEEREEQNERF